MSGETRCRDCGSVHALPVTAARCSYLKVIRTSLTDYAGTLEGAPKPAEVTDLWAHARDHRDDGALAALWVRAVLDLGWRPTVGGAS